MQTQIAEIIAAGEYDYYGLRCHHDNFGEFAGSYQVPTVGAEMAPSYVWDDEKSTGEELGGVCALRIFDADIEKVLRAAADYPCRHFVLLGSYRAEGGEDPGEIIMSNAEILAVWSAR